MRRATTAALTPIAIHTVVLLEGLEELEELLVLLEDSFLLLSLEVESLEFDCLEDDELFWYNRT